MIIKISFYLLMLLLVSCSMEQGKEQGEEPNQVQRYDVTDLNLKDYRPVSVYNIPATRIEKSAFPVIDMHSHDYADSEEEIALWVEAMKSVGIEKLAGFPLGDKLYLRVDWRNIQKQPGRLDFPDHWKITFDMARKYNKQVGLRIQLMSPVIEGHSVPDFLVDKIPFVELGKTESIGIPEARESKAG